MCCLCFLFFGKYANVCYSHHVDLMYVADLFQKGHVFVHVRIGSHMFPEPGLYQIMF